MLGQAKCWLQRAGYCFRISLLEAAFPARIDMPAKKTLPFGTWPSPVTAEHRRQGQPPLRHGPGGRRRDLLDRVAARAGRAASDPEGGERRGRQVEELLPAPFSARSRVHEYGGGEFLVAGETIYFVNDKDQQVYRLEPGAPPRRITDAPGTRFADFALDASRQRLIAVAEIHPRRQGATPRAAPQRTGGHRPLGQDRADRRAGRRAATSTPARACPPTASSWPSSPGTCPTCRGTAPPCTWRAWATTAGSAGPRGSPAETAAPCSSRSGTPTAASISSGTRPAGASSIAGRTARSCACHGARGAELTRPQWVFGSRSYALHPDGTVGMVSLSRGMPLFEVRDLKGGKVTRYRAAAERGPHASTTPLPSAPALPRWSAGRLRAPAIMRMARGGLAALSPAATCRDRAGLHQQGRGARVPPPRRADRVRHLLRAEERDAPGPGQGLLRRLSCSCTAAPRP